MSNTRARAKQVTYKSDATGGAVRNLHDKLSETVSVKDFGAVGDGVTDDTAAIQAAVDTNKSVFFPAGSYVMSIEISNNCEIIGSGKNTIFIQRDTTSSVIYSDSATDIFQYTLKDFKVIAKDSATVPTIDIHNQDEGYISNLFITTNPAENSSSSGIRLKRNGAGRKGFYVNIENCFIDKHFRGITVEGGSGYLFNAGYIRGCVVNNCSSDSIFLTYTTQITIDSCSLELSPNLVTFDNSAGGVFSNSYTERPDDHNVKIISSDHVLVTGNTLSSYGTVDTTNGRGVKIVSGTGNKIRNNTFKGGWTSYEIGVDASASETVIEDNIVYDRVSGLQTTLDTLNSGTNTYESNFNLTGGGSFRKQNEGLNIFSNITTLSGTGMGIGETNAKIYAGSGSPETVVTASRGSLFLRTNGGGGFTLYVKETGDGTNTGWVAK